MIDFSPMKKKQDTPKVGVSVFLEREDGRILMMLRKGSHRAGTWSLPSGHIDIGETGAATCKREIKEELGIVIKKVEKYGFIDNILKDEGLHYVTLYYKTTQWDESQEIIIQEPNKIAQVAWIDPSNPPKPLFSKNAGEMIKKYAQEQQRSPKKAIEEFVRSLSDKQQELKEYLESEKFNKNLRKIKRFFKNAKNKCIDDEGAHYHPESFPLSSDQIAKMVEAVQNNAECSKRFSEADNQFPNESCEYKGLIFRIMNGQGTSFQIWDKTQYYEWLAKRKLKTVQE